MSTLLVLFILFFPSFLSIKLTLKWLNNPTRKKNDTLNICFAPPGCGKTTLLSFIAFHFRQKGYTVYSNVDLMINGCVKINWEDVGTYDFRDCVMLIDEAGIDLNNRKFKDMSLSTIKYLKLHRHYRCHMWYFSQSYEDMNITVRRLADAYFLVSKTLLSFITHKFKLKRIRKFIGISDEKKIDDTYDFVPLSTFKFNGKKYWQYFDSFDAPKLREISGARFTPYREQKSGSDQTEFSVIANVPSSLGNISVEREKVKF